MTNMVVVLEAGRDWRGQASCETLTSRTASAASGQGGVQPAGDGDDFHIEAGDGGKDIDQLVGLAAGS